MRTHSEITVAQTAPEGGGGLLGGPFLLLIAMFLVMYAVLIRPQQRQQKEHRQMIAAIERGDRVVTSGGIHGRVTGLTDDVLTVEIANNVQVKINRAAISNRILADKEAKS